MDSLRGHLLISSGGLFDPNFRHTVVLIGEHNADGALGVVLNRALDISVNDALPALRDIVTPQDMVFQGGPVRPASAVLLAQLTDPSLADVLVFGSVGFLVGDVSADLQSSVLQARVFLGYSGWGPGQLESEMADNSWIVDKAQEEDVFTDTPELLWSRVVARKGPEYRLLSRMPYDPSMN